MRFSVITCTLNSEPFLTQSIDSVLSQHYSNIEYVFVDGGSVDGTLERIRTVPGDVKILQNIKGGISHAMNAGIEAATGDVIVHLHSDDYFAHPLVLHHVEAALNQSGAKWCFGRCLSDIDGQVVPENYRVPTYSYRRLLKGNFIPHPATFVRASVFAQVGLFDESIKYAMDYDMWLRLGKLAVPVQLDEHLAVFRWHPGSLTTTNRMASFEEDYVVRRKYASRTPWCQVYHLAHYLVRRRRLSRKLMTSA